ncbi:MAG TPA: YggT family protein [Anaerolineales bacterium]|nr:YggT family protein [Anaerolineales bacterium]
MAALVSLIHYISLAISLLVIAYVILSYFMDPFHPVRMTVNRIVEPLLNPIRRILPSTGMIDFSPLVLLILVQVIEYILARVLLSF